MNKMNRKAAAILAITMVLAVASIGIFTEWEDLGTGVDYTEGVPETAIPFTPGEDGELAPNALNKVLFEKYGAVIIVLGIVMFTAMVAGVCVSREEEDSDD